jgi:hypothetical protein
MRKTLLALAALAVAFASSAKLPPPDDAAKAKAAETAAKAAWQAKVDAYQLCKAQDKVAAKYGSHHAANGANGAKAMPVAAKPAASAASSVASAASSAASSTTPAVASAPPPCTDPGPFAYNPPEQKPLEVSGAHSPAGTAANPPSVKPEAGKIQPSGKK